MISLEEARLWLAQSEIRFDGLPDRTGVDPLSEINFQAYLSVAHILTRLVARYPQAYSLSDVHKYLAYQEQFAESHGLVGWLIEVWLVRALMYHVEGKAVEARRMIEAVLSAAARRGYFRIFLDEGDLLRPLLESVEPRLKDNELSVFVKRLLEGMPQESVKVKPTPMHEEIVSDRERYVLSLLAVGQSYKEIGQNLFLSLNTVQIPCQEHLSQTLGQQTHAGNRESQGDEVDLNRIERTT